MIKKCTKFHCLSYFMYLFILVYLFFHGSRFKGSYLPFYRKNRIILWVKLTLILVLLDLWLLDWRHKCYPIRLLLLGYLQSILLFWHYILIEIRRMLRKLTSIHMIVLSINWCKLRWFLHTPIHHALIKHTLVHLRLI